MYDNPPYYLTAYGLAVKRGFTGTLDEWLASLVGPQGPQGVGFVLLGSYATEAELRSAHPTGKAGDCYKVGTGEEETVFYWDPEKKDWESVRVMGPTGQAGKDGATGPAGADGTSVTHSWNGTTLTVTSASGTSSADLQGKTGENGANGNPGPAGADGMDGTTFIPNVSEAGVLSWTNDGGLTNPEPVDIKGHPGKDGAAGNDGADGKSAYQVAVDSGFTGTETEWLASLKGADGTSFSILGRYSTLDELMAAHPIGSEGDAWAVGSAADNDIYLWDVDAVAWTNIGSMQGPEGPTGKTGADGVGIQSVVRTSGDGSPGTTDTYTITLTNGATSTFSVYNGANGAAGPAGEDGTSFSILGRYSTLDELMAAHPTGGEGDAWAVGSATDNDIYLWDVDTAAWTNIGSLQGPPGPAGQDGANGATFTPAVSEAGVLSFTNDGGLPNPEPVNIKGPPGADGKTAYQYAVDGGYTGTEEEFKALMGTGPWLPLAGGTMTGKITGIVTPTADEDAANKAYVDGKPGGLKPQIIVSVETGANVTAEKGASSVAAVSENGAAVLNIPEYGSWTVTASKGGKEASGTVFVDAVKQYKMELSFAHVYGVEWDGSSTTKWTRTDESALFTDPVPYVAGASAYGSPFDNLQPWVGMVKSTRTGGVMVAIPKFWYKLTKNGNGLKIQIADRETEGFSVSPAHMNRGDGKGERDVVYIGRYHCGSDFKSNTGQMPKLNTTRANFRTSIHALGSNIWQADFAIRFTLWLLYLVEFADWNTQKTIGKGCGNNSAPQNMGYTDSMPYHTGTTQSSRDTFGLGTQYRYLEGLWDNVLDWEDGCYNSGSGLMIILNPNSYSDSSGGVSVGTPSSGYPSAFTINNQAGFPVFVPTAANGSDKGPVGDDWNFSASYPAVCVGGYYSQGGSYGLFCRYYNTASYSGGDIGSRLHELP